MKKGLIFFLFCLICEEVFAGVFSVIPTDKSQEYLGIVFGGSVGAINLGSTNNPTLSLMFERFNFIIVTVGAIMLSYIGVMTTINTAREGEAMGKKMSLWVPLRAVFGMLLMVPGPTSGYSVIQMTVMWIVLNGIGAANMVWNVVLEQLMQSVPSAGGLSLKVTPDDLFPLTQNVLQASTCMYVINNQMSELRANAGPLQNKSISVYTVDDPANSSSSATKIVKAAKVQVGVQDAQGPYNALCGSFAVQITLNSTDTYASFNPATAQERLNIKIGALQSMFSAVQPAAQLFASGSSSTYIPPDAGYVYAAGQAYINQMVHLTTIDRSNNANFVSQSGNSNPNNVADYSTTNYTELKKYGWIHAGSYYFEMVRASKEIVDAELTSPPPFPMATSVPNYFSPGGNALPQLLNGNWPVTDTGSQSALGQILSSTLLPSQASSQVAKMNNALTYAFNYWKKDQSQGGPSVQGLAILPVSTGDGTLDAIVNGIRTKMQKPILEYVQSITDGSSTMTNSKDPLISIGQFGGILMLSGEISIFASIITSFLFTLATAWGWCTFPGGAAILTLFMTLIPMIYAIAVALWTFGATLGIYIPLIPYLIFTMTAFGWIIQVIEAVVAAPIIALALLHPEGEEIGKAGTALGILANIFLKPTLMIFGFVLGASLLRAGIAIINFGFIPAITGGAAASIFSILAVLGMYIGIITVIVNKSFSLIYELPNKIMRWMGGPANEGEATNISEVKDKGFDKGAEQGQKGVETGLAKSSGMGEGLAQSFTKKQEAPRDLPPETGSKPGSGPGAPPSPPPSSP